MRKPKKELALPPSPPDQPLDTMDFELNSPAVIDAQTPPSCRQPYLIELCDEEKREILQIVHEAIKYRQRSNWQKEWLETNEIPDEEIIPAATVTQSAAYQLLNMSGAPVPDSCPPLPRGTVAGPLPPVTSANSVDVDFEHQVVTFASPRLIYWQQVVQYSGTGLKLSNVWFYDDFSSSVNPGWLQFENNATRVVGSHLSLPHYAKARAPLPRTAFEIELQVYISPDSYFFFIPMWCNGLNHCYVYMNRTTAYLVKTEQGSSTTTPYSYTYSDYMTVWFRRTASGATQFGINGTVINTTTLDWPVAENSVFSTGTESRVRNYAIKFAQNADYPYDFFDEQAANLRPAIDDALIKSGLASNYDRTELAQVGLIIDAVFYTATDSAYPAPYWQSTPIHNSDVSLYLDFAKTDSKGGYVRSMETDVYVTETYNGVTYRWAHHPYYHKLEKYPLPNPYEVRIQNKPIILSYNRSFVVPATPISVAATGCRTGMRVWLKWARFKTRSSCAIGPQSTYVLTKHSRTGGNDWSCWGGGFENGDGNYQITLYWPLSHTELLFCASAETITVDCRIRPISDDPVMGDPPVPVPRPYVYIFRIDDQVTGALVAQHYLAFTGKAIHRFIFTVTLPALPPGTVMRKYSISFDDAVKHDKIQWPCELLDCTLTSQTCD